MNLKGVEARKLMLETYTLEGTKERRATQQDLANHLKLSLREVGNKLHNRTDCDILQCLKIANFLKVFEEERILTEEGIEQLDEYRKELEYFDTLNAQY